MVVQFTIAIGKRSLPSETLCPVSDLNRNKHGPDWTNAKRCLVISIHFGVSGAERPRLLPIRDEQMRDRDFQPILDWIQTIPGKGWFMLLRLYSPRESFFIKAWRPSEVALVR
jgi:hypothetical protein